MGIEATYLPGQRLLFLWTRPGSPDEPALDAVGRAHEAGLALPDGTTSVHGRALEVGDAAELLVSDGLAAPAPSTEVWSTAAQVALSLIARRRYVPTSTAGSRPGSVRLAWAPLLDRAYDRRVRLLLAGALPPAGHSAATSGGVPVSAQEAVDGFIADTIDSLVRRASTAIGITGIWEPELIEHLGTPPGLDWHPPTDTVRSDVMRWLEAEPPSEAWVGVACLDPPNASDPGGRWRVRYLVRSVDDPSDEHDAATVLAHGSGPQRRALLDAVRRGRTVGTRGLVAGVSLEPPTGDEAADVIGVDHAWQFIMSTRGSLQYDEDDDEARLELGGELATPMGGRLQLRLRAGAPDPAGAGPDRPLGGTGGVLEAIAAQPLSWEVLSGDQVLSPEEIARLIESTVPLAAVDGRWLILDDAELATVRRMVEDGPPKLGPGELVAAVLAGELTVDDVLVADVEAAGEVARLARVLRGRPLVARPTPDGFVGTLRGYQSRGLDWLRWLQDEGLGGCLADDMGLGKTVQTLALAIDDPGPTLVVCPTSVLGNWEHEVRRFAPPLRTVRHHGPERAGSASELQARLDDKAVVVTTYAIMRRDVDVLAGVPWHRIVLDEAQHIKNPASDTARACRTVAASASHRLALTGTPVENDLVELWSILDYANPGLLGTQASFRRRFAAPIERNGDAAILDRLKRVTAPFLLRRRKSDPSIVADLPAKHETTIYASLTPAQATIYQATVEAAMARIAAAGGIERRGLVLALLTRLKQICSHPALVMADGAMPDGGAEPASGKLALLLENLDDVRAAGDRSLVFTQFVQMGHILADAVGGAPFLHGSVSRAGRDEMVRRFQEDPSSPDVLVVSLRAGGLGLNLTAANRVFHYDRWWNPAVEDQATDRAHRIGQTRDVWVHRFVSLGTLEERIDEMLERKRGLADRVIGSGEGWLTELSDDELVTLVTLEEGAVL